jgi:CheY-like chemotaxis protein
MSQETSVNENRLRVLVVDDNADQAASEAMLLEMHGHKVEVVFDGPSALAKMTKREEPDVILLDIGLPDMDGWEVAKQVRRLGKQRTLIVAITGYGKRRDLRRSAVAGIDFHMLKPVNPDELTAILGAALKRKCGDAGSLRPHFRIGSWHQCT